MRLWEPLWLGPAWSPEGGPFPEMTGVVRPLPSLLSPSQDFLARVLALGSHRPWALSLLPLSCVTLGRPPHVSEPQSPPLGNGRTSLPTRTVMDRHHSKESGSGEGLDRSISNSNTTPMNERRLDSGWPLEYLSRNNSAAEPPLGETHLP